MSPCTNKSEAIASNRFCRNKTATGASIVNSGQGTGHGNSAFRNVKGQLLSSCIFIWVNLSVITCPFPGHAQSQQGSADSEIQSHRPTAPGTAAPVRVGQLDFDNNSREHAQPAGAGMDFGVQEAPGILHSGNTETALRCALALAAIEPEARTIYRQREAPENQVKNQKEHHALGIVPNIYVAYSGHVAPLTIKQKFRLAWNWTVDPRIFALTGITAGIEQAQDDFRGYGQGAQGYAKRYGAAYGNLVMGTFIGSAILPSVLSQDPRYFYKGSGSRRSRFVYAIANSVICRGDDGRWQVNFSNILGNIAMGGISNLYYPAEDRHGAALTFENAAFGIGVTAVLNVIQEFLTRKPNLPAYQPASP